jgi:DNA-binding GntR family transcriptional regulator
MTETQLTPLQARVAREIVALVRHDDLASGERLVESALAARIGTSRSPVNVALRHLGQIGVLRYDINRGYSMAQHARELASVAARFSATPSDPLYLRIAQDRLAHELPDIVAEGDLIRRYAAPRSALLRVLSVIQEEGWIERQVGHSWRFMPMIDSLKAYEESYLFRAAIEPTGILSPSFRCDPHALAQLRRRQQFILDGGYLNMTPIELFEANCEFHEALAGWSDNRFIAQSVRRIHRMRRLIEYRQDRPREPRGRDARDHLAILAAIEAQDLAGAAALIKEHIESARHDTAHTRNAFPG